MNKLPHNPNFQRFGLPLFLTIAMGATACSANKNATPPPIPPGLHSPTQYTSPECTVTAKVHGRKVVVDLETQDQPSMYIAVGAEYIYGDGQQSTSAEHTYRKAGNYTIGAIVELEVAPDVTPLFKGNSVSCHPATVQIP